jgi:D-alanine-D-alanine ligase
MPAGTWPIVTYAAKWDTGSAEDIGTEPICPARLTPELSRRVTQAARQAWDTLTGSQGYGRVDLRITEQGEVYVLEVNPNPDLSADAGLARMGSTRGWDYPALILKVVEEAVQRFEQARATESLTQHVPA